MVKQVESTTGRIHRAIIELRAGFLTKSVATTDGFHDTDLNSGGTKHIWIDVVRGRNCTAKMYATADEDVVTTAEKNTQFGPDLTAGVVDNLYPLPGVFFNPTMNKHLTLIADKPCTVEFTILLIIP